MWLIYILLVASYVCLAVAAAAAALVTLSFTKMQRSRYRWLRSIDGKQLHFAATILAALVVGYGAQAAKDILLLARSTEVARGPGTSQSIKATRTAIETEISQAADSEATEAVAAFAAGDRAFAEHDYRNAATAYRRSALLVPTKSAYLNLAIVLRYTSEFDQAIQMLAVARRIPTLSATRGVEANCVFQQGSIYVAIGEREKAEALLEAALKQFQELDDSLGEANTLLNLGVNKYATGRLPQGLRDYEAAERLYERAGNVLGRANVLNNVGISHIDSGHFHRAVETLRRASALYQVANSTVGETRALNGVCNALVYLGKVQEGVQVCGRAVGVAKKTNDRDLQALSFNNLAAAFLEANNPAAAYGPANEALAIAVDTQNEVTKGFALETVAMVEHRLGNQDLALRHATESLALLEDRHAVGAVAARLTLGRIFIARKEIERAEQQFRIALQSAEQIQYRRAIPQALVGLADAALVQGKRKTAREFLIRARLFYLRESSDDANRDTVDKKLGALNPVSSGLNPR